MVFQNSIGASGFDPWHSGYIINDVQIPLIVEGALLRLDVSKNALPKLHVLLQALRDLQSG
jgi:hypothetical protein